MLFHAKHDAVKMDRGERIRIQCHFPFVTGLLSFQGSVYFGIPARSMAVLLSSDGTPKKMPLQTWSSGFDNYRMRALRTVCLAWRLVITSWLQYPVVDGRMRTSGETVAGVSNDSNLSKHMRSMILNRRFPVIESIPTVVNHEAR